MSTMNPEERQKIINGNRALRNIKNELETLLENGFMNDETFEKIMSDLPPEKSQFASSRAAPAPTPAPAAPVDEFRNMSVSNDAPPAYNTPNVPAVPSRQASAPPPKPEIGRAVALYRYTEPEDCTFEVGDNIAVYEHMNNEWWLGKNLRTGKEGVFPVNYVQVQHSQGPSPYPTPSPAPAPYGAPQSQGYYNEKSHNPYGNQQYGYPNQYPGQYQQPPPPQGPSNPYNAPVPPMAVAEQQPSEESKGSKAGEMGKKFGSKLGNAAIFGAGATIGGNIVNSIF